VSAGSVSVPVSTVMVEPPPAPGAPVGTGPAEWAPPELQLAATTPSSPARMMLRLTIAYLIALIVVRSRNAALAGL
jgi:hypothetical protein